MTETTAAARVYVVQETSKLNLAKASQFGTLIGLLPESTHITMSPQPVLRELRRKLKHFTDNDYLLLIGDPVAIAMAVYIASEANVGRVRCLKWDNAMKGYYTVNIDLLDRMKEEA